jgi:hypothetical protein
VTKLFLDAAAVEAASAATPNAVAARVTVQRGGARHTEDE